LLGATPTEATRPTSPFTRTLICCPTSGAVPEATQPRTSRNASSRLNGSTNGGKESRTTRPRPAAPAAGATPTGTKATWRRRRRGGAGGGGGQGAGDAEGAGLVGGRADHAAPGQAADDDRLAAPLGPVALLDGGVEGVQVDVQDGQPLLGHRTAPAIGALVFP